MTAAPAPKTDALTEARRHSQKLTALRASGWHSCPCGSPWGVHRDLRIGPAWFCEACRKAGAMEASK